MICWEIKSPLFYHDILATQKFVAEATGHAFASVLFGDVNPVSRWP